MAFGTSQTLFGLNQEPMSLTAACPSVRASVECYNVSHIAKRQSALSHRHFMPLLAAFSCALPDYDHSTVQRIEAPEQAQANTQ
jgi:hypothetical protein